MTEDAPKSPAFTPPVSSFSGPIGELIAQRMLLPPSRPGLLATVDQFEILRVLGGGGMGIVLLARDSDTNKNVAIKLVRSDLVNDQNVVHRFLREASRQRVAIFFSEALKKRNLGEQLGRTHSSVMVARRTAP